MKFHVSHKTIYTYRESVPLCHNVLHLWPRNTPWQSCGGTRLTVDPLPAIRREQFDFFGNRMTWLAIQEPHRRLSIQSDSDVETHSHVLPDNFVTPPWDQIASILKSRPDPAFLDARQYTFDSPHVPLNPTLARFAAPSFAAGAPLLACVQDLTQRIFHDFVFDTWATHVGTPVMEVLDHRRGVCQDFAHLQIGCLRSLGIPARYVSGYVMTNPPPGRPRLVGADASHAWLSVFIPDFGWLDLDPTNGVIPSDHHITLAWGRDYSDVIPVTGIITGGHQQSLSVAVDVEPTESAS